MILITEPLDGLTGTYCLMKPAAQTMLEIFATHRYILTAKQASSFIQIHIITSVIFQNLFVRVRKRVISASSRSAFLTTAFINEDGKLVGDCNEPDRKKDSIQIMDCRQSSRCNCIATFNCNIGFINISSFISFSMHINNVHAIFLRT